MSRLLLLVVMCVVVTLRSLVVGDGECGVDDDIGGVGVMYVVGVLCLC